MHHQGPAQDRNLYPMNIGANQTREIDAMGQNIGVIPEFFHIFSPLQFDDYGWSPDTWENTQWNRGFGP